MNTTFPLLVLGAGYVGRELLARAPSAIGTRRMAPKPPRELTFSLGDPATWEELPVERRHVVWTFPAAPLDQVKTFHEKRLRQAASLLVLGSTSAYITRTPDERVTEETPLDPTQPRVQGEEWLRQQGATVLQLAGIFGPGREPLRWLEKGLIKNGLKRVNLIHVSDIADIIFALTTSPHPRQRFNVSNGTAPTWNELAARLQERGALPKDFSLPQSPPGPENKIVTTERLATLFPGKEWVMP